MLVYMCVRVRVAELSGAHPIYEYNVMEIKTENMKLKERQREKTEKKREYNINDVDKP